jgi:hypothetical protein
MDVSTMQINYCTQWSRQNHRPHDSLTEDQARSAHEQGKLYTVLVGNPLRPDCFLEITAFRSICVEFLDNALRTYLTYSFQEKRPNELFISMSRRPSFPNNTDPPDRATVLFFKTDGQLKIERFQSNPNGIGSQLVGEESRVVDVTHNWERYPRFGDYAGIATRNRCPPLLSDPRVPSNTI